MILLWDEIFTPGAPRHGVCPSKAQMAWGQSTSKGFGTDEAGQSNEGHCAGLVGGFKIPPELSPKCQADVDGNVGGGGSLG